MRYVRMTILVLLGLGGLVGLWSWGDRQAQELGEWRRVWGGMYLEVTGEEALPEGASVETLGRNALKAWELAQRGGAEVRGSVEELEGALAAAEKRTATAEKSLADLRAAMEAEEAAAVAELRERYLAGIEASRAEVARAREERAEAVKALAAAQTRLAEQQATLDALMSTPGDALDLVDDDADEPETEVPAAPELPEPKPSAAAKPSAPPPETPLAAVLAEAAPELSPEEIAALAKGEAAATADAGTGAASVEEASVVASRVIGESKLFLTLTYREADGSLRVQFQNGSGLVYAGVPRRVADALRDAENKIDTRMRERVKGKFAADGDEDAVWKACSKWSRGRQGRMEALWVEEE